MHGVKIRTLAGLSGWSAEGECMSVFGFFTTQAKSGSTVGFRMSSWSGKTGCGSVFWMWFQPKLQSGRTHGGSVSVSSTVG
ncbi:hypothetical protein F2Q70_00029101 [Brassica cretica]|uniref:Uncharacterized protein n=1 Tax=Brassica cretica TaxID=69181 RepID=A0A8S9FLU0_BRACR|nr:hypothetical protein F2Q70_00029101 [Brassica cretica]